jgi:hypothetical protein
MVSLISVQLRVSSVLRGRRPVLPPPVTHASALPPSAAFFLDLTGLSAATTGFRAWR